MADIVEQGAGRRGLRAAVGVSVTAAAVTGVVLAVSLTGSAPAAGAKATAAPPAAPAATPASAEPVARDGRFTRPWALDGGRFRVDPAPAGQAPAHSRDQALAATRTADDRFWTAAAGLGVSGRVLGLGAAYGLVTLPGPAATPGAPSVAATGYRAQPAWVVWYRVEDEVVPCPMQRGAPPAHLPALGPAWQVFVLPDRLDGAVQYTATHLTCGTVWPGGATVALRHLGVAWTLASRHAGRAVVRFTLPPCGVESTSSSGGSPAGWSLEIVATAPFGTPPCPAPVEQTRELGVPDGVPFTSGPVGQLPG